ncbi:MAG: heavy metal translocating P-type ATPase, partial [Cyanobacteria bacterium P01_A01_bin.84]
GDIIREQTARSTNFQTASLMDTIGHSAWVERDNQIIEIPSDRVEIGDTVIVYPGEQVPVDGTVFRGEAVVNQQQLTGESMPVLAESGTRVYASTLVQSGEIYITAERIGDKTKAAASIEMLQKAPVNDTRMANYASQIADKLILPCLGLAGLVLLITRDTARAASILTLDFVTGIRVSIPTAFLSAINHSSRHSILVRSGRTLELLAEVDTLVFDKTGTLTQGELKVVGVESVFERISPQELLKLAAACEQQLTHPVAEAVSRYAVEQEVSIPPRGEWNYEVGLGVRANIEGKQVLFGSDRFLRQEGISLECLYEKDSCIPQNCRKDEDCPIRKHSSLIYLACDGKFQGIVEYADPLRKESPSLIKHLQKEYGMEVHLLTGDNRQRAHIVAEELKIPPQQVHAEAFPEQKAKVVRELHHEGKTVGFVGDGINDSVALAYADVSISFENGSDVARETADVVLMHNDLTSLLQAIAIAKQTKNLIDQNTALVIAPNLIALGLASTTGLHPLIATAIHNGSAIAAGLNSLRPLVRHQLVEG